MRVIALFLILYSGSVFGETWSLSACSGYFRETGDHFDCSTKAPTAIDYCSQLADSAGWNLEKVDLGQGWAYCYLRHPSKGNPLFNGGPPYYMEPRNYLIRQTASRWVGHAPHPECRSDMVMDSDLMQCVSKEDATNQCTAGNPIRIVDGVKVQKETDATLSLAGENIALGRLYSSSSLGRYSSARNPGTWTFKFLDKVVVTTVEYWLGTSQPSSQSIVWHRSNGERKVFSGISKDSLNSADKSIFSITPLYENNNWTGWRIVDRNSEIYEFNVGGRLTKFISMLGNEIDFSYPSPDSLVASSEGALLFNYDIDTLGRVVKLVTPDGVDVTYHYDTRGNLSDAVYGDVSKIYHYEDSRYPSALTGITNENGTRYVTWEYDEKGKAIKSENAGGVNKVVLSYENLGAGSPGWIETVNPLGKVSILHVDRLKNGNRIVKVEGQETTNCAASNTHYTYWNDSGLLQTKTEKNGLVSYFEYSPDRTSVIQRSGYAWIGSPMFGEHGADILNSLAKPDSSSGFKEIITCREVHTGKVKRIIEGDRVTLFNYIGNKISSKLIEKRNSSNESCVN